ncbi:MAG: hypothetical protein AAF226_09555, partial [Verrucomicrobiota bacterium]
MDIFIVISRNGEINKYPLQLDLKNLTIAPGDTLYAMTPTGEITPFTLNKVDDDLQLWFADGKQLILYDFYVQRPSTSDAGPFSFGLEVVQMSDAVPLDDAYFGVLTSRFELTAESDGTSLSYGVRPFIPLGDGFAATVRLNSLFAADDLVSLSEWDAVTVNPSKNDYSLENYRFEIRAIEGVAPSFNSEIEIASGALVTLRPDGSIQYVPSSEALAKASGDVPFVDSFSYSIIDQEGNQATAEVVIAYDPGPEIGDTSAIAYNANGEAQGSSMLFAEDFLQ